MTNVACYVARHRDAEPCQTFGPFQAENRFSDLTQTCAHVDGSRPCQEESVKGNSSAVLNAVIQKIKT